VTEPTPTTFASPAAFRAWLRRHGKKEKALVVRFLKAGVPGRGLTYAQALDEALCFGWIDGVRRRFDAVSYTIRFTPRKPRSTWSHVNVAHVGRLTREGRMAKPGLAVFTAREAARSGIHSFERREVALSPTFRKAFRAEAAAWRWFEEQAPWYRRTCAYWVMSAKRDETRARRLATLISCSARGRRVPPLEFPGT
jgi:uncharacterized protein YdeI (YjbR/CyaY-like superfamily)